ncbi:RHS repeat-associated core domain-containing protein [Actimicrobium antarcticum]|uniref:RHS repeat-associated core domain-containing protein n=1 Tax=Actimicrobium antarcticum TaxID=1051899 RepID=A0ABP7SWB8_9BURK
MKRWLRVPVAPFLPTLLTPILALLLALCIAPDATACPAVKGGPPDQSCSAAAPASQPNQSGPNLGSGNPINVITGNKYQREEDMPALPGVLGLELVRHYNSAASGANVPNGLSGRGWRLSYETGLHVIGNTIQIAQADGSRTIFSRDPANPALCVTSNPADGQLRILRGRGGDEYLWTWQDGRQLRFNHDGKLEHILAVTGEFVTLQYDRAGLLVKVTDPQGRSLQMTYPARDKAGFKGVTTIDSPVGQFTYRYGSVAPAGMTQDPGVLVANLVAVSHAGASRQYHYEDIRFPTLLTGITVDGVGSDRQPLRQRISTWAYDLNGLARMSVKGASAAGVEKVTLDFAEGGKTLLTNSLGQTTAYRYAILGGAFRLLEVRGAGCATCAENNVRYGYDTAGRLIETTHLDSDGTPLWSERTDRDSRGRPLQVSKVTLRNGVAGPSEWQVRYAYDDPAQDQPTRIMTPSVHTGGTHQVELAYNRYGQITRLHETGWSPNEDTADPIKRTTTFEYAQINGRSVLVNRNGTRIRYDARGDFPVEFIAPGDQSTRILQRDTAGRPLIVVGPDGIEHRVALDAAGRVLDSTRAQLTEHFRYDALGQLTSIVKPDGQRTQFSYGPNGRITDLFDAQNNRIRLQRDTEDRLLGRTLLNPDGSIAQEGERSVITKAPAHRNGEVPALIAALRGMPADLTNTTISLPAVEPAIAPVTTITDARTLDTSYRYDDFGRLVSVRSPETGLTVFRWDAGDHLVSKTQAVGSRDEITTRYRYDAAGRIIEQSSPDGVVSVSYGKQGRPETITFPAGQEHFRYDSAARLTSHSRDIDGQRFTTRYTYDQRGQLTRKTLPDGQQLDYRYHGQVHVRAGLLAGITRKDVVGSTVLLDGLNDADDSFSQQRYRLANGVEYRRELDRQGRLVRLGAEGAWQESQQHDAAGLLQARRQSTSAGMAGAETRYAYDRFNRLTGVSGASNLGYDYDPGGNLLSISTGQQATNYAIDPFSNRPLSADAGNQPTTYRYNAHGGTTVIGDTTYTWDSQQRLIRISNHGKPLADYRYNAFGERIKKVSYSGNQQKVTYYFYDGSQLTAEAEGGASGARITRQYVWLDDQSGARPIAMLQARTGPVHAILNTAAGVIDRAAPTDVYALVSDHTGAPRAAIDSDGRRVWQATVTGYGKAELATGNQLQLNLRGSQQYFDDESGLHYNFHRYLDARTGRYLSADPSGQAGGLNLYAFAENNPLANVDPLGLQSKPVSGLNVGEKFRRAMQFAIPGLPRDVASQLMALVTPENIASTVQIFVLWAASETIADFSLSDTLLLLPAFLQPGTDKLGFLKSASQVIKRIAAAQCDFDLEQVGQLLAQSLASSSGSYPFSVGSGRRPPVQMARNARGDAVGQLIADPFGLLGPALSGEYDGLAEQIRNERLKRDIDDIRTRLGQSGRNVPPLSKLILKDGSVVDDYSLLQLDRFRTMENLEVLRKLGIVELDGHWNIKSVARGQERFIDPRQIRFTQQSAGYTSSDKINTLDTTGPDIKKAPEKIPAMDVVVMPDGRLTSLDNRRLAAAMLYEAGSVRVIIHAADEPLPAGITTVRFSKGYPAKTWADAVAIRIYNQGPDFREKYLQGSSEIPLITKAPENSLYTPYKKLPQTRKIIKN